MIQKLKPLLVQESLKKTGLHLFSPEELRRFFLVEKWAMQAFIKNHMQDLFIKLRNGLYALRSDPPNEYEIANRLYFPSYISFEYALAHYRIIPETVYSITSATTKITRTFVVQDKSYEFNRIKKEAYRGYRLEKQGGVAILMAEPEKALVDYLYFVDLKLKPLNERLYLKRINKQEALHYASLFKRGSLMKLLKDIL